MLSIAARLTPIHFIFLAAVFYSAIPAPDASAVNPCVSALTILALPDESPDLWVDVLATLSDEVAKVSSAEDQVQLNQSVEGVLQQLSEFEALTPEEKRKVRREIRLLADSIAERIRNPRAATQPSQPDIPNHYEIDLVSSIAEAVPNKTYTIPSDQKIRRIAFTPKVMAQIKKLNSPDIYQMLTRAMKNGIILSQGKSGIKTFVGRNQTTVAEIKHVSSKYRVFGVAIGDTIEFSLLEEHSNTPLGRRLVDRL